MKKGLAIVLLLLLAAAPVLAEGQDEVAQWRTIGIEKSLGQRWDIDADLEYRAQDKARFSAGIGASFKVNKYLKLGAGYSFMLNPQRKPERWTDKNEFPGYYPGIPAELCPDEFTQGYNYFKAYHQPPRHRVHFDVAGSVKLWKWLRISLRERVQLTYRKAYSVDKLSHREKYVKQYDFDFDDDWNVIDIWTLNQEEASDEWSTKDYESSTDRVLRSRLKLEVDKKKWHLSPYISAEAHNSISKGDGMLLQKVRTAVGVGYKWRKHHEFDLSYVATFSIYDKEDDIVEREYNRLHAISMGYSYSF